MKINKNKKNKLKTFLISAALSSPLFFGIHRGLAETSISQLTDSPTSSTDSETQAKIDELEKRAEIYRQIIEIKQKQSSSLRNQIDIMESNIRKVSTEMEANKREFDELNDQVIGLQRQIDEKEKVMINQINMLSSMIQTYYEYTQQNTLSVFLTNNSISDFMIKKDRLAQTGDKINELLSSVKNLKAQLEANALILEDKKEKILEIRNKLVGQGADLESTRLNKQNLLNQTKGEESRYSQLLQRVEEQKLELLDIDQLYLTSGLSVDNFPKPDASLNAPLSWFYSQRDSRWANTTIGNSNTLMKSYGCAVTAVAMVLTSHGDSIVTPQYLAKQPIFSWDLISWPSSWSTNKLKISSSGISHGNINWSIIDNELKNGHPVIVFIKKTNGGGGHYVTVHHKGSDGKYVVHDPYFGPNIYLDTTRALVAAMGGSSGTTMDQMIIYK